jgi:hypothetical protein
VGGGGGLPAAAWKVSELMEVFLALRNCLAVGQWGRLKSGRTPGWVWWGGWRKPARCSFSRFQALELSEQSDILFILQY